MDNNVFNNLLNNLNILQTRLRSYKSFKNKYCRKNNSNIPSKIIFCDQNGEFYASFTLDSNTSHEVLSLLIERTKADLETTAEMIKNMITEDKT